MKLNDYLNTSDWREERVVYSTKHHVYSTTDLYVAAYLLLEGLEIVNAKKTKKGVYIYVFGDPEYKGKELAMRFLKSVPEGNLKKFSESIRNVKSMTKEYLYSNS
jgi:5S rRNA maturation endonuclease (ribonuclease M5)